MIVLEGTDVWVVAVAATIAIALWALKSPGRKGRAGESRLRRKLKSVLHDRTYHSLHDLTLPDYDGTAQIDHVVVSPQGVFAIETKNYSGWIYGSESQRTWTHVFHRRRYTFQNPLRQNYNHVKTLQSVTGLRSDQIHSLVAFVGSGEFRTPMPANVITLDGLRQYFSAMSTVVLADSQITEVVDRIETRRLKRGLLTNWRHRRHIREILKNPSCPKCQRRMVARTARRGTDAGKQFWGCPRYPRCTGTRPFDP